VIHQSHITGMRYPNPISTAEGVHIRPSPPRRCVQGSLRCHTVPSLGCSGQALSRLPAASPPAALPPPAPSA
jgi:hypothetical protein